MFLTDDRVEDRVRIYQGYAFIHKCFSFRGIHAHLLYHCTYHIIIHAGGLHGQVRQPVFLHRCFYTAQMIIVMEAIVSMKDCIASPEILWLYP